MKLDAWLRQNHPLGERLRLVERLSQALNAVHDRGEILAALDPSRIEVGSDLRCDLSATRLGSPEPGYSAPERREGGPPSPDADVYAVGAVAWEVLVGRPCGEFPAPLGDVAPDLPPDLASAVMGCLERSPQWRPRDLTYLAQLSAARQKAERVAPEPEPADPWMPPPSRPTPPARIPSQRPSRSHLPLLVAALLVLVAAAVSFWRIQRQAPAEIPPAPRATAPATPPTTPSPVPTPTPTPAPTAPTPDAGLIPTPTPRTVPTPATTPRPRRHPRPLPTPAPTPRPTPTPAPALPAPAPTPRPTPTPAPALPTPTPAAPPAVVAAPTPAEAAVLTAVSPLSVRRPGKALLDLRGTGLHPGLHARVLPLRDVPRGIIVARQRCVSANLMTVLLELDETVVPGTYAIALEDASGGQTKALRFTVTK